MPRALAPDRVRAAVSGFVRGSSPGRSVLVKGEVALGDIAGGAVDLREQVALAQLAVGVDDRAPWVEGISDQQLTCELAEEGAALRGRAAPRSARDRMLLALAVDGGFRQLTRSCPLGAHEHPDDPLGAQNSVGQVGADRSCRDLGVPGKSAGA